MLGNLPDIQFVETDVNVILVEMIESFEDMYYQHTGTAKKLYPGDPIRIFIYTQALRELQLREIINYTGKQNLISYAENEYLDHMAARYGLERFGEAFAVMMVQFTLSANIPTLIPAGTRLMADGIYFETADDTFIESGQTSENIVTICQVPGVIGNDISTGATLTIVDPLPFVISAVSIEQSTGGTDRESDEELRERIYSTPESLSVAGPEQAYISIVKNYSNAVSDVLPQQISPGVVGITVLLEDGTIPNSAYLQELEEYLSDGKRRPLTDHVVVNTPAVVLYDIDVVYYLLREQSGRAQEIALGIEAATNEYVIWQKSKIGRDINPDELTYQMRKAGAKRIVMSNPTFLTINSGISPEVAIVENVNIVFGGFENE